MSDDILEIIEVGLTLKLRETCLSDDDAADLVGEFIQDLRESYGGERYQIKRGYRSWSPRLVARIRNQFTGRNERELMARYRMPRSTFYRLIKK